MSKMVEDPVIKVDSLTKSFKLPHEKLNSIKSIVVNFGNRDKRYEMQKALDGISFEVRPGEFFGIVGRNGSGKSTLLKVLAGIYEPNKGTVEVKGKLAPFIELGVGMNPELSGRDNVYLSGSLLGFTRKEMDMMYDDIVLFAELEKFMDQKLKNYSSGMQVRLAFSIAIQANSDILLIDEVLAVGDLDFQKKCYNYFFDLKKRGKTIVFVSHDMSAIRRFCTRGIIINEGKIMSEGKPDDIAHIYESVNLRLAEVRMNSENKIIKKRRQGNREAEIVKCQTFNPSTRKLQNTFSPEEKIGVRLVFRAKKKLKAPAAGFIFQNQEDKVAFATNNQISKTRTKALSINEELIMETVVDNVFTDGEYTITAAIESEDFETIYDRIEYIHKFMIGGYKLPHAYAHPRQQTKLSHKKSNERTS